MPYQQDYSGNTRVDIFIYCMAAISYITMELAAVEGILKFIAVCISIVGFSFTALNQGTKYFRDKQIRKNQTNDKNNKSNIRGNRKDIK